MGQVTWQSMPSQGISGPATPLTAEAAGAVGWGPTARTGLSTDRVILLTPQRFPPRIEHMFERVAGPDLGPALAGFDVRAADGEALVEALAASQRLVSWAQALPGGAGRRGGAPGAGGVRVVRAATGYDVAAHEVGAACGCRRGRRRPGWTAAWRSPGGRRCWRRCGRGGSTGCGRRRSPRRWARWRSRPGMARRGRRGGGATALERAPGQTAPQVRAALARLVLKADPAGADARLAAARRERRVWVDPREDGMAELRALLAAPDAQRVYAALGEAGWAARCAERDARRQAEARAAERGEPPLDAGPLPTLDQCRADALVADGVRRAGAGQAGGGRAPPGLGWLLAPEGPAPREPPPGPARSPRGQRPQILVTVPAGTLLGLGGEPAHLAGYGPIPDSTGPRARPGRRVAAGAHRPRDGRGPRRRPQPARPARRPGPVRPGQGRHVPVPRLPTGRPPAATSTTPSRTRRARRPRRTCTPCAAGTTASSTRPAGRSPPGRAAGWSGPAPSEPSTPPTRPTPAARPGPNVCPPTPRTRASPT